MSIPLPATFQVAPLPADWAGTPQQFSEALAARLSLVSAENLSFFTSGSVAPTTNSGPFLLNGQTWYVWSDATGQYIPQIVDPKSLKYIASQVAPDSTIYTFWIQLDSTGNPIGIKYFFNNTWTDIYATQFANYSTTEQINQILSKGTSSYPAAALTPTPYFTLPCDGNLHVCSYTNDYVDPYSIFDAANSRYIAQVTGVYYVSANLQLDNSGAQASSLEFSFRTGINGNPDGLNNIWQGLSVYSSSTPPRFYPTLNGLISLNQNDSVQIYLSGSDAILTGSVLASNGRFQMSLVQRL